jgi:apolipoprotein N-acyltransferase
VYLFSHPQPKNLGKQFTQKPNVTNAIPPAAVKKLCSIGVIAAVIGGSAIYAVIFLNTSPTERAVMLSTGTSLVLLGISWILQTIGYKRDAWFLGGAWFATGLGVGLIMAYVVVVYALKVAT